MRANEDKEKGLVFNGPFYGPIAGSDNEAKVIAKDLSNQARSGAVISKIFPLEPRQPIGDAMVAAKPIFERIRRDMVEAREIIDRPIRKKRKKKK